MGRPKPVRTKALVVEIDHAQRQLFAVLFEEIELCDGFRMGRNSWQSRGARLTCCARPNARCTERHGDRAEPLCRQRATGRGPCLRGRGPRRRTPGV